MQALVMPHPIHSKPSNIVYRHKGGPSSKKFAGRSIKKRGIPIRIPLLMFL